MNDNKEFWQHCVEWLVMIGALPHHHRACDMHAEIFDLAQTLRDGVVLCNILNILAPGVVDESAINHKAQMSEFLCMENIRVFIYTLQTSFRIPPTELFTAEELYRMENFAKVLNALSYLSCLPEIAFTYQPFQKSSRQNSWHHLNADDESIYGNLSDLASERALADEDGELYDCVPEEKDEGVYGSLIDVQNAPPTSVTQKTDRRGCCINEIIETETNYVASVELMVDQYMVPLREVIPEHDIRTIFMNIEQLRPIHTEFRDDFLRLQQNAHNAKFSEPFKRHMERFLIYGDYCSKMIDAQDLLDEIMKNNEAVRLRVEECQMRSSRPKFKLRDLLCLPMQRILKYHLLVKELNKHTPNTHEDKASLGEALEKMKELSQYINEVKRDSEELVKINQIEARLDEYNGISLRLYGRVQRDGELKVKFVDDKSPSTRNVFLFDKALIMTKLKNFSYVVKDLIRLEDMQLDEMTSQKQSKTKWSFAMKLFSTKQGPSSYVLYCKTSAEKDKWLEAFKNSFCNINPYELKGKRHSFEMQTFPEPTKCDSCSGLLKGIFYQGYECTVSAARCHKSCLADTLKLIENGAIGSASADRRRDKAPPVPDRGRKKPPDLPSQDYGRSRKSQKPVPNHSLSDPGRPLPDPGRPLPDPGRPPAALTYKAHREYKGVPAPPYPNAPIITFQIGQPIDVLEQVTPEWWKGKSFADYDRIGFFPASFVSPQSQRQNRTNYMQAQIKSPSSPIRPGPKRTPAEELPVEQMPGYAGEIDRPKAEQLLWEAPSGTFLIRKKIMQGNASLVISLKFQKDVKHIKVLQTSDNLYYVAECKNFRSLQDLIGFYQQNSLSGFFHGLETTLRFPYRDPTAFSGAMSPTLPARPATPQAHQRTTRRPHDGRNEQNIVVVGGRNYAVVGVATAKFDFAARSDQELSLRAGQVVNILSTAAGAHGWWKGEFCGQVGYFPTTFVEE